MNKIAHISVRDIRETDRISLKTIELNRVSIFFHEIFRINVKLPDFTQDYTGLHRIKIKLLVHYRVPP